MDFRQKTRKERQEKLYSAERHAQEFTERYGSSADIFPCAESHRKGLQENLHTIAIELFQTDFKEDIRLASLEDAVHNLLTSRMGSKQEHTNRLAFAEKRKRLEKKLREIEKKVSQSIDVDIGGSWFNLQAKTQERRTIEARQKIGLEDQSVKVNYKQYFTVAPETGDVSETAEKVVHIWETFAKLGVELITGNPEISMKIAGDATGMMAHQDNFIVYYRNAEQGNKLRKIVQKALKEQGVETLPRPAYRVRTGFDFEHRSKYDKRDGSHTTLIARLLAFRVLKEYLSAKKQGHELVVISDLKNLPESAKWIGKTNHPLLMYEELCWIPDKKVLYGHQFERLTEKQKMDQRLERAGESLLEDIFGKNYQV